MRDWIVVTFFLSFSAVAQTGPFSDKSPDDTDPENPSALDLQKMEAQEVGTSSPRTYGIGFQWSLVKLNKFNPSSTTNYAQVYGRAGPYLAVSYDTFLLQGAYGVLTFGGASGVFFDHGSITGQSVSLMAIPFTVDFCYRAEIVNRQLWIPFVRVGTGGWYYRQKSVDTQFNTDDVQHVLMAGIGTDLLLDFFLWDYSKFMDTHFGINWTTITGEFKYVHAPNGKTHSVSHWRIDIGVRFEI